MRKDKEPNNLGRIYKKIFTGEGPNGEDVERTFDRETETLLKEVILQEYDTRGSFSGSAISAEVIEEQPSAKKVISAAEMLKLAIKEKEQTFGKRVQELLAEIMDGCKLVILEGKYSHRIDVGDSIPAEVIRQAAKDLKTLGYKVKVGPDPKGLTVLTIRWPVKEEKPVKKQGRHTIKEVAEAAPPLKERPQKPAKVAQATGDTPEITFSKEKSMPGGRPPRPKPRKAEL